MKNFIGVMGIGLALFRAVSAEASVGYCLASGYVQLDYATSDWIEGVIGEETVGLAYYETFIYGEIKGEQVELIVNRKNNTVTGKIGKFSVRWHTDGKGHIFGFQRCLFVVPEIPR
jgi:hypothetical protein